MSKTVKKLYYLLFFSIFFLSCSSANENANAIKHFRKQLQLHLTEIVSKGIVYEFDSTIRVLATDKDLERLSQSEHPILRAVAFREMLYRPSFDHFKLIMTHLDDTAIVATDDGKNGIWYKMISDDILANGKWKDTAAKNKTIDLVITKHNYLKSAYTILANQNPQNKYYPYIKEMAQRDESSVEDYDIRGFYEIQSALYGLAKFKNEADVNVIKESLMSNTWTLNELSFKLMKEFPNEAYLDVYEKYYPKTLYYKFCQGQKTSVGIDFINTLATYKNERSARILDAILNS